MTVKQLIEALSMVEETLPVKIWWSGAGNGHCVDATGIKADIEDNEPFLEIEY